KSGTSSRAGNCFRWGSRRSEFMVHRPSPYNPGNTNRSQEEMRLHNLDNKLQADPEMAEGPASGARIAMYGIAIALVLGVVFYGLNTSGVNQTGTTTPNQAA